MYPEQKDFIANQTEEDQNRYEVRTQHVI